MAARTKSKVTPKFKTKYRVKNWWAYEAAIRKRVDITSWFDEDAVDVWNAPPNGRPGGQRSNSDLAIVTALTLRGVLHRPDAGGIRACVLFAHCFTCTKNIKAAVNIADALVAEGIAVLRFDFAGLGESEGEFADTHFSSNVQDLVDVANYIAPEHLELSVENPQALLPAIRHAGAIFMGRYTAEALGDYCAGPNHVLPTSGTARFSSPLGVYDFQKRSSIIHCSARGASELGKTAVVLARGESLTAHARSAQYRISDD